MEVSLLLSCSSAPYPTLVAGEESILQNCLSNEDKGYAGTVSEHRPLVPVTVFELQGGVRAGNVGTCSVHRLVAPRSKQSAVLPYSVPACIRNKCSLPVEP